SAAARCSIGSPAMRRMRSTRKPATPSTGSTSTRPWNACVRAARGSRRWWSCACSRASPPRKWPNCSTSRCARSSATGTRRDWCCTASCSRARTPMPSPDTPRWDAIERLLDAALDRPAADREAWVRAQAGDARVAAFVLDLLAREARIDGFLEDAVLEQHRLQDAQAFEDVPEPPAAGQQIGAWRLLRELGSGGMAVVWLAERADGAYSQQVALKLVRPGLEGTLQRERFARERRILALLQHPR